jgi:hypothetical protein
MKKKRPFKVGDKISVGCHHGTLIAKGRRNWLVLDSESTVHWIGFNAQGVTNAHEVIALRN